MPVTIAPNALCTIEEIGERLGVEAPEQADELQRLVNGVSGAVESYLFRNLFQQTYTNELHDGHDDYVMLLEQFPITALTSVSWLQYSYPQTETWIVQDIAQYVVDPYVQRKIVSRYWPFVCGMLNWRVTYTAGYTIATMPWEIIEGGKLWMIEVWRRQSKQLEGVASVRMSTPAGTEETTYRDGLSKDVTNLLDGYRKVSA